jgi:hypothetical protein
MIFDKKIKYLIEVLGSQQTIGGYKAQSRQLQMDEEQFKTALVEFNKTFDPQILLDALTFAENNPNPKFHIKFPFRNGSPKWIGANELHDAVEKKYFTKGSKDYIDHPLTDKGTLPDNRTFQSIVKRDHALYPKLKGNPVVWLNVLQMFNKKGMEASDRRQQIDVQTGERISPDSFFYYIKSPKTGQIFLKQARVTVTPDGKVTPTPFSTAFDFKKPQNQAIDPKTGMPISYKSIAGGIPFDQFIKTIFANQAKKDKVANKYPVYTKGQKI